MLFCLRVLLGVCMLCSLLEVMGVVGFGRDCSRFLSGGLMCFSMWLILLMIWLERFWKFCDIMILVCSDFLCVVKFVVFVV